MVIIFGAIALWFTAHYDSSMAGRKVGQLFRGFTLRVPQMIFFVLLARLIYLTYVAKVEDRFGVLKSDVRSFVTDRDRMLGGFLATILMTLTLIAFAQMKNLLPRINPFGWDVAFMELDKALHFGVLPHEHLLAVFGSDPALTFFTGLYNIWLFMMYFVLLFACFLHPSSKVRMQYLVAFILTWAIGGNLLATVFSSAGPVYYANLGLGDAYATLMARLYDHADTAIVTATGTQELLWFVRTSDLDINAISAFPSMHVASTVLMTIFAFQLSRLAGIIMAIFTLCILIGSVLLAWHYAVDGYIGAAVAILCWFAAGVLVRQFGGFAASAR
jgi:PAP2 superfamily